jgi:hypothetical protein
MIPTKLSLFIAIGNIIMWDKGVNSGLYGVGKW